MSRDALRRRVYISGGMGYLGGRIARDLASRGFDVWLGTRQSHLEVPTWLGSGRILTNEAALQELQNVDAVIHLAALNEIVSGTDPIAAMDVNAIGTLRLVKAAERAQVKKFVYFSTAHVYGAPLTGHLHEALATRPTHPYAYSHRAAEDIVFASKIPSIAFRLSNAFGAPERIGVDRWSLVFNDLCWQAINHGKLVLKTTGSQKRDFIAMTDVTAAVAHCLRDDFPIGDGLFNLGNGQSMSILEAAHLVQDCFQERYQRDLPLEVPGPPESQVPPLHFAVDKLQATGFVWQRNLREEVGATLKLCEESREHHRNP